jgi:hydrogenase nickel incorporation protein HypA/HybF
MHEMSVAVAVVEQVEQAARGCGADRAGKVTLQVGELAGIVPDALRFCFSLACAGTVLEGAELVTEPVPGRAGCGSCGRQWPTGMPPELCCPDCGAAAAELLSGRELQILSVSWTDPPPRPHASHASHASKER